MSLRKLAALVPVIATLSLAAPVASAGAQTSPPYGIPCYPYPAFCGPGGQPWFPFPGFPGSPGSPGFPGFPGFPSPIVTNPGGPISPASIGFGPGSVQPAGLVP